MAVYKEEKTNTWRVIYRYTDWNGERKQSQKKNTITGDITTINNNIDF